MSHKDELVFIIENIVMPKNPTLSCGWSTTDDGMLWAYVSEVEIDKGSFLKKLNALEFIRQYGDLTDLEKELWGIDD